MTRKAWTLWVKDYPEEPFWPLWTVLPETRTSARGMLEAWVESSVWWPKWQHRILPAGRKPKEAEK